MKLIIAGSRTFRDIDLVNKYIESGVNRLGKPVSEVVSGTARGVDKIGEMWASTFNLPVKRFPADWSLGKVAGILRNRRMAEYADAAIVLIQSNSSGSSNMAHVMLELGKPCVVFKFVGPYEVACLVDGEQL